MILFFVIYIFCYITIYFLFHQTTLVSVDAEREKLNSMNDTLRQLKEEPLTDQVNELNEKWGLVVQALNQKVSEMEQGK